MGGSGNPKVSPIGRLELSMDNHSTTREFLERFRLALARAIDASKPLVGNDDWQRLRNSLQKIELLVAERPLAELPLDEERALLHDIASPLGVALFHVDPSRSTGAEEKAILEIAAGLEEMKKLLVQRRALIRSRY